MQTNPLHQKEVKHSPLRLLCIVGDYDDSHTPEVQEIREYCSMNGILFSTRIYAPRKFADDKHYVESLPAFHIYAKKAYMRTVSSDVLVCVKECAGLCSASPPSPSPSLQWSPMKFFKRLIR